MEKDDAKQEMSFKFMYRVVYYYDKRKERDVFRWYNVDM